MNNKVTTLLKKTIVWKSKSSQDNCFNSNSANTSDVLKNKIIIKYKKINSVNEIAEFQKEAIDLVMIHLKSGEYKNHYSFLREINFLLHYTFNVLQDDFFLGDKYFLVRDSKSNMTSIDDYVFSQYRKHEDLKENIKKLATVAFSNRFDSEARSNLLSYYVFIEESGLEIIKLLEDFYVMLANSQTVSSWTKIKGILNLSSNMKLSKQYKKEEDSASKNKFIKNSSSLIIEELTKIIPLNAQKKIADEMIEKEENKN